MTRLTRSALLAVPRRIVVSVMAVSLAAAPAPAQPTLTDFTFWNSPFATGEANLSLSNWWNTEIDGHVRDAFLSTQPDATYSVASVVNPATSLSLPLHVGTTTLYFYGSSGIVQPSYGVNLFFGSPTPAISAVTSYGGSFGGITNPTNTIGTSGNTLVPAAGALTFVTAGYRVTLGDFRMLALGDGTGGAVDRVSAFSLGADGLQDLYGSIRLTVAPTAVPEPTAVWLLGSGLAILGAAAMRRHARR